MMKSLFAAIRFLTIIPLPQYLCGEKRELLYSKYFFPLIGLMIGAMMLVSDYFLSGFMSSMVRSSLLVMILFFITKGLHLDGLADTFDAFFSSRSREEKLRIMKDSRSGPMGVIGLFFGLWLKILGLHALPNEVRFQAMLLFPFVGRISLLFLIDLFPYAKKEGLGLVFQEKKSLIVFLFCLSLFFIMFFWFHLWKGVFFAFGLILIMCCEGICFKKQLNGWTGDTLGAALEVNEIFYLLLVPLAA